MIRITDKAECCGCNACGDVCPQHAITFQTDTEGFWYPLVDEAKCTNCALCEKVCPIINAASLKRGDFEKPACYAAVNKNVEVVFDSSSGGVFSALAGVMYKKGGFVGGAVFNADFSVSHFISNDKHDLPRLRSAKWCQSSLEGFFLSVRKILDSGGGVLVCASPCQIAALRAFLDQSPATPLDNLITVDYVCRGINSPKVWRKYLDSVEMRYGSKVVYCKTQCKEYGWRNLTQKTILENGKHVYDAKRQSGFVKASKEHLLVSSWCRPSCYDCRFKGFPRTADITIADFWGIEKVCQEMDRNLGTSLVMVNSKKGEHFFDLAKPHLEQMQVPLEKAVAENRAIHFPLEPPAVDRSAFFEDLDCLDYSSLAQKYDPAPEPKHFIPWLKKVTRYPRHIVRTTRLNPVALWQFFRYNTLPEILRGDVIIFAPHCVIKVDKGAVINKKGITTLGRVLELWNKSPETRIELRENATLNLGPNTIIRCGAAILVKENRTLTFKGHCSFNTNLTILSGGDVEIGEGVMAGWGVEIRAGNFHWVNRAGYQVAKPVVIGDHVWLCEGCTIAQGVKVGDGAIVGSKSVVTHNVPEHSMVAGNPAQVVDEDVLWKP